MSKVVVQYDNSGYCRTEPLVQYDYGQTMVFEGFDLPEVYEVHFSNCKDGISTTQLGNADGVAIPDMYLQSGQTVYAWLFLHEGAEDGKTVFIIQIPVVKRAKIYGGEPTPVQQDIIEQAIAALNAAVAECQTIEEKVETIWEKLEPLFDPDEPVILDGMDADDI